MAHEFAHALVAQKLGIPVPRITLFIFGAIAQPAKDFESPAQESKIAVAGPLASIGCAILFFTLRLIVPQVPTFTVFLNWAGLINIIWAIFNLMPIFPMDGGRILRAAAWNFFKNRIEATRIAFWAGVLTAISLFLITFNFWIGVIGALMCFAAKKELDSLINAEKREEPEEIKK